MTESDRQVIREWAMKIASHTVHNCTSCDYNLSRVLAILDADTADHATIAGCRSENAHGWRKWSPNATYKEGFEAGVDAALVILDADKPTVPMAMLRIIAQYRNGNLDPSIDGMCRRYAKAYGYGVTE